MTARGASKHSARLRRLANIRPALSKVVYAAADALAAEAAISITTGSVGGKNHVASEAGEAPNADSGVLDRSVHVEKVKGDDLSVRVVADAPYAAALEFGSSTIAERPFMRPAAARIRPEMNRKIGAVIKKLKG